MQRFLLAYVVPCLLIMGLAVASLISGSRTLYHRDVLVSHYPLKAAHDLVVEKDDAPWPPLVDPYRSGGQPLAGNPNVLPIYPTNLVYRVADSLWALNAHFWLHWLLAPLAVFWLGREWGLSRPAAWAAGVTYAGSGYFLSQLNFYNLVTGAVWVPAFAAACLRAAKQKSPWPSIVLASVWALLILAGDPMTALVGFVFGASVWLAHRPEAWRPASISAVGSLALGTLVAAPMWVEFLRILPLSYRGYWRYSAATTLAQSWNPQTFVEWLIPFFFGNLDYNFWGYRFFGGNPPLFYSLFPGVLALVLVIASRLPRDARAYWCWGSIFVGAFLAAGYYNPVMRLLYEVPGASALRYPVKCWILTAVAASILAGVGFDRFLEGDRLPARLLGFACVGYLVLWGVLIVMPGPLAEALRGLDPDVFNPELFGHQRIQWATSTFFVFAGCLVLFLGARQANRRSPFAIGALLLAVHTALQCFLLQPLIDTDEAAHYTRLPPPAAEIPKDARLVHGTFSEHFGKRDESILTKLPGNELFWLTREEFASMGHFAGVPHGYRYELNFSPEGLDSFYSRTLSQAFQGLDDLSRIRLLAAVGVDRLLLAREVDAEAADQVRLVARVPGSTFDTFHYELERTLPEAKLVGTVVRAEHMNHALSLIADPAFDPRTAAVLPAPGPSLDLGSDGTPGTAEIMDQSVERLEVKVDSPEGGLLATRRAWLPIYRAWIDGEPADLEIVNLYKLGVMVPPGEHRVVIGTDRRPTRAAVTAMVLSILFLGIVAARRSRAPEP